jgi:Domain of unknown function (DUF2019)
MKQPANPRLKQQLKKMPVDELVGLFRQYVLEQDEAMLGEEHAKVNRLVWKLKDVGDELKSREGDQRSALLSLYITECTGTASRHKGDAGARARYRAPSA